MSQPKNGARRYFIVLLVTACFQLSGAAFAQREMPQLGTQGQIDSISLKQGLIVVSDRERRMAPGYKVVDSKGKRISAFNLKPGVKVKLELDKSGQVTRVTILK